MKTPDELEAEAAAALPPKRCTAVEMNTRLTAPAEALFPPHVRAAVDAITALSGDERRWLRAYMDVRFPGKEPTRGERMRALLIASNLRWMGARDKEAYDDAFGAPVQVAPAPVRVLTASMTWDPPTLAPGDSAHTSVHVHGVRPLEDSRVEISPADPRVRLRSYTFHDAVYVELLNASGETINVGVVTLTATVVQEPR